MAGGNWIKEILLENCLNCSCKNNCEQLTWMKPQISLKLIFSFSFKKVTTVKTKPAGGDSTEHILVQRGERRKELWPGFNSPLHFFPQQNTLTAPHAFHHQDVIPSLAAVDPGLMNPRHQSRKNISANIRGKSSQVSVSMEPQSLITFTTLLEIIFQVE